MKTLLPLALLLACKGPADSGDSDVPESDVHTDLDSDTDVAANGGPIVIVFTTDTLGLIAAEQTGWCERISDIAGAHGLDVACEEGAVSPSSWTGEGHTRLLWPQHMVTPHTWRVAPACGKESVLQTISERFDGDYFVAADNPVIGIFDSAPCVDGNQSWFAGTEASWKRDPFDPYPAEADSPVHFGIDAILAAAAENKPVTAFLNAYEVGGHFPRCYWDPYTPACEAMWDLGVEAGIVAETDDREQAWLAGTFDLNLSDYVATHYANRPDDVRAAFWDSMKEAIEHHRGERFDDRLEKLLAGLETSGRLDDLTLVIVSDHGENPCTVRDLQGGILNCTHTMLATEYTAIVPVYVVPAARAEAWKADGFIGDRTNPWSTVLLSYALLDEFGIEEPSDWPVKPPLGEATSWTCLPTGQTGPSGIRIVGRESGRCDAGECGGYNWAVPDDESYQPTRLDEVPAAVSAYTTSPTWFQSACAPR